MLRITQNGLLALLLLLLMTQEVSAQFPLRCDDQAVLSLRPSGQGANPLYQTVPGPGGGMTVFLPDAGVFLSCLGYSVRNEIYGLDSENYHLYRIAEDGTVTNLGYPEGLDTTYQYRAGTMAPDGLRMLLIGYDPELGRDRDIFSIRVNLADLPVGRTSVVSENPVRIGDVAFDPLFGNAYGFDELNQRLVNIGWPGGLITSYNFDRLTQVTAMGALFFDSLGVLYGYGSTSSNGAEKTLFTFNKNNGTILATHSGPSGLESDGCSCPYRIDLQRIQEETVLLPCQEFRVTYAIQNRAGRVIQNITLTDLLPPGFSVAAIDQVPYPGDFSQGVGDNALSYDEFDLLIGSDTLIVRLQAPQVPGEYSMQAMMDPFPAAFNFSVFSDDPVLPGSEDPNQVRVISDGNIFTTEETFLCPGSSVRLETGLQAGSFLWSDGSTAPFLEVYAPGEYQVEVTGDCGIYRDTIQVSLLPEPLRVDLGTERDLRIGSFFSPQVVTNAAYPLSWAWTSDEFDLDCFSCPQPEAGPVLFDGWISVTASNAAYGCIASDSLFVRVLKDRAVYMPNVFSPDADGINDWFFPQSLEYARIVDFFILDRWGSPVFRAMGGEVSDPLSGWDGRINGQPAPMGTYIWHLNLEFQDGYRQQMTGDVTIVR